MVSADSVDEMPRSCHEPVSFEPPGRSDLHDDPYSWARNRQIKDAIDDGEHQALPDRQR